MPKNVKEKNNKPKPCFIDEFYDVDKNFAELVNCIRPIASFAGSDTYELVKETNVHAHPIFKGYPSNVAPFIMLRAEGGKSDALYQVMQTIDVNPCDKDAVNELSSSYPNIVDYIKKRIRGRGFKKAPIPYRFYVLRKAYSYRPVFNLGYNPQGLVYLSFADAKISNIEKLIADFRSSYEEYKKSGLIIGVTELEKLVGVQQKIEEEISKRNIEGEERKAFVKIRVNQSYYRDLLIRKYKECCLCGVDEEHILIASHIKPWVESSSEEKTDVNNGLLLCPNHDRLFDSGYISFADDGKMLISKSLSQKNQDLLNVHDNMSIEMTMNTKSYMAFHREKIYKK